MKESYADWALHLITIIAEEKRLNTVVRLEEIKCAARPTDAYSENFKDGDTPEEAWQGEIDAIADSQ